jgi:predicted dehydrogenase
MRGRDLRVGLVGCGGWGKHILRDLRSLECAVTVVTRTEASAAQARALGAERAGTDLGLLEACDGVVVATPTVTHAEMIEAVLPLGIPIFTEKPLSNDVAAARSLTAQAPERLFVMDKWRYHPGILELARLARSGALGQVQGLRTLRVQRDNPHADVDCVWILAPHDLSIGLEVLGAVPTPVAAVAHQEGGRVSGLAGQLRIAGGPWQTVEVASNAEAHVRRISLYCSEGVATLADGWDEEIAVTRTAVDGAAETRTIPAPGELPLLAELRAFVEHLDGGPPPRSSAAEGLLVVEAIAELRRLADLDP